MSDLDTRLERLQQLLGQGVQLVDSQEDADQDQSASPAAWGRGYENTFGMVPSDEWMLGTQRYSSEEPQDDISKEREIEMKKDRAYDCTHFRIGEPLGEDFQFCPMKVVVSYPERFIGKTNRPRAKPYFDRILLDKVWDIDPYLLIPSAQFEVFLEEINLELGISLRVPVGTNTDKFYMQFGEGATPRPRYLRRSQDEASLDVRPWPSIHPDDIKDFEAATPDMQMKWRAQLRVAKTGFIPKRGNPEKAAMKMRHRGQMLKNTQGYLGLKGDPEGQDVVFVCVDVEAIERPPNPISEIGFAILDTRDIKGVAPGLGGRDWWPLIKCHHLRVWEYAGLRNRQFVKGCPDAFNFGESTFPRKAETGKAIMAVLDPYLKDSRNIAIVGHDIKQDIKYLKTLGVDLVVLTDLMDPVDTQDIHQAWRNSPNGRGLGSVLSDLKITSKNLHNAGNDAYFTLCAMLGIAVEAIREEEDKKNKMLSEVD
ncbi:hypothetical protein ACJ41O_004044 [Fusarium nematophilum]